MKTKISLCFAVIQSALLPLSADLQDAVDFFAQLAASPDAAVFPVSGRGFDDIESAFGPRLQTSTDQYDWHRGIDVDGALNTDEVVAPLAGTFYDYRTSASGGYTVILEHNFSDFLDGAVPSISYGGETLTKFYTWHLHLFDDEIADNGTGTDDIVSGFTPDMPIARGQTIGILGNSGSSGGAAYGPHLHFELRIGTNSSLQFQLDNEETTQWGFDPHINPMFLFESYEHGTADYQQSLTLQEPLTEGADAVVRYATGNDEMALLNQMVISIINLSNEDVVASHELNYNERIGFDPESTAALDTQDTANPYINPLAFGDGATDFVTEIIVPAVWLDGYVSPEYALRILAVDIWGNPVQESYSVIPEPGHAAVLLALGVLGVVVLGRRCSRE